MGTLSLWNPSFDFCSEHCVYSVCYNSACRISGYMYLSKQETSSNWWVTTTNPSQFSRYLNSNVRKAHEMHLSWGPVSADPARGLFVLHAPMMGISPQRWLLIWPRSKCAPLPSVCLAVYCFKKRKPLTAEWIRGISSLEGERPLLIHRENMQACSRTNSLNYDIFWQVDFQHPLKQSFCLFCFTKN